MARPERVGKVVRAVSATTVKEQIFLGSVGQLPCGRLGNGVQNARLAQCGSFKAPDAALPWTADGMLFNLFPAAEGVLATEVEAVEARNHRPDSLSHT